MMLLHVLYVTSYDHTSITLHYTMQTNEGGQKNVDIIYK